MAAPSARAWSRRAVVAALVALVVIAALLHMGMGSIWMTPAQILTALFQRGDDAHSHVVWALRLPRVLACLCAGALLGMTGAAFQSLFRNPLADPYVVGVSSGAAVGGALAIVLGIGTSWGGWMAGLGPLVLGSLGGLGALALVISLSMRRGVLDPSSLLLTGVVIGALLSSVLSLILLWSGHDSNVVLGWLLGHMSPAHWNRVTTMATVLAITAPLLLRYSKQLNVLAIGDDTAQRLGVDPHRYRPAVLVIGSVMVAVTVGAIGIVGFLGLVAPHIARRLLGVDWRYSMVGAALVGAGLLCAADILAQRIVVNAEVPVGIVTAVLGAPFLIALMRRKDG